LLLLGALAGYLASSGSITKVFALAALLLPVAVWKRPHIAPAILLAAAVLVEQTPQVPSIPLTQRIPLFQGVGPGHIQGGDMLLLLTTFVYLIKSVQWGPRWWPRSHVTMAMYGVLGCAVLAIVIGHAHGGDLRISFMEARPYVYLAATYFLTAVLVTNRKAIQAMLWGFVGSVGFKSLQGIYLSVKSSHMNPKPDALIGHEASYFFVIFFMLVPALWVFRPPGRLRAVATGVLPFAIFACLVNDRRVAWEMLGGAALCFGVIVYQALPKHRRRLFGKVTIAIILGAAVYFPVMWNKTNSVAAQPVRAVKSQIQPSVRDGSSDLYRVQENANLELNIKQGGVLGKGFGVKIDYALPIDDISKGDALIAYVPHDDVLDVMMRMGILGGISMWFVIGAGIIAGSRLARSVDREAAVIGVVVASSMVGWAIMAAEDQGFYMYRLTFMTGCLLGLAEAVRRLQRARDRRPALR
jgi:hypothetical protein